MILRTVNRKRPRIHPRARLAENIVITGDVEIGKESSVWYGVVIRGDVNSVHIGERTNIQDLSCLHVTHETADLWIGDGVTVGHMCLLHGCRINNFSLIGMGSIVMDKAIVGELSLVGAGSLVTERTVIPPGVLAFGRPARVVRPLTPEEKEQLKQSAENYVRYSKWLG
ncbi:MAG: gamma carbonic anhydrase family protein [Candidatus Hydrogenedentota bacterium]|nr:MAG: gamma carbonic anhydrase family protein [Candidatus Hydrogenedentota bacterium]